MSEEPIRPITPDEISEHKKAAFPGLVIKAFNDLIADNWDGSSATFTQSEAVTLVAKYMACTAEAVYSNHWLDVEDIFREAGWKVVYERPGWNESDEATFKFSRQR